MFPCSLLFLIEKIQNSFFLMNSLRLETTMKRQLQASSRDVLSNR